MKRDNLKLAKNIAKVFFAGISSVVLLTTIVEKALADLPNGIYRIRPTASTKYLDATGADISTNWHPIPTLGLFRWATTLKRDAGRRVGLPKTAYKLYPARNQVKILLHQLSQLKLVAFRWVKPTLFNRSIGYARSPPNSPSGESQGA